MLKGLVSNLIFCVFLEIFVGVIIPEGAMKKFCLCVVGVYLFSALVAPICNAIFDFLL